MRARFFTWLPALIVLWLSMGCTDPDVQEPAEQVADPAPSLATSDTTRLPSSLADTRWRLIEFQSMDDTSARPQDTSRYVLELGDDGRVHMQLNCNRAIATWWAEQARGGNSGLLNFGPLATTRATCPPPSMDEQVARDMAYVRGYLLLGDTLSLSLMADGGIYLWRAVETAAE